ncbi:hypothetical protein GCM10027456_39400 [Kineosporia babensis]
MPIAAAPCPKTRTRVWISVETAAEFTRSGMTDGRLRPAATHGMNGFAVGAGDGCGAGHCAGQGN